MSIEGHRPYNGDEVNDGVNVGSECWSEHVVHKEVIFTSLDGVVVEW